jgi:hypothetical protein
MFSPPAMFEQHRSARTALEKFVGNLDGSRMTKSPKLRTRHWRGGIRSAFVGCGGMEARSVTPMRIQTAAGHTTSLVDLKASSEYGRGHGLPPSRFVPPPIQVHYLGYPGRHVGRRPRRLF